MGSKRQVEIAATVGLFSKRLLLLKTSTLLTLPLASTMNRTITFPASMVLNVLRGITGCGCDKAFSGVSSSSTMGGGAVLAMAGAAAALGGGEVGAAAGGGACGVGSGTVAAAATDFSDSSIGAYPGAAAVRVTGRDTGAGAGAAASLAVGARGLSACTLIQRITLLAWRLARSMGSSVGADAAPAGATSWPWATEAPARNKARASGLRCMTIRINRNL